MSVKTVSTHTCAHVRKNYTTSQKTHTHTTIKLHQMRKTGSEPLPNKCHT